MEHIQNLGFVANYALASSIYLLCFFWMMIFGPEPSKIHSERENSIATPQTISSNITIVRNFINQGLDIVRCVFRSRPGNLRLLLVLQLSAYGLYFFNQPSVVFLFGQRRYEGFSTGTFAAYKTMQSFGNAW